MPAPKAGTGGSSSSSAVIALTALFLIAAIAAVVFYVKGESARTQLQTTATQLKSSKSAESAAQKSLDEMVRMSLGQAPAEGTAENKLAAVKDKFKATLTDLASTVDTFKGASPDTEGMLSVVDRMKDVTAGAKAAEAAAQRKVAELTSQNESLRKSSLEKEEQYAQIVQKFAADANSTQSSFGSLQGQMDKNAKDQVVVVEARLAASDEMVKNLQTELKDTKIQLETAKERLGLTEGQLNKIVPAPDTEVAAFRPDGQVISMDSKAGLVYINLGLADKVYRGLTFTVYDKGIPIPRDGKGKAEIEVLEPRDRMSIARIAVSNPRKPVLVDDTIANLVWDSNRTRTFVVAGDFSFSGGKPDADGAARVKALIAKWGGTLSDKVTPSTDFVVLGEEPKVPQQPTGEEIAANPAVQAKYQAALASQEAYQKVVTQAKSLSLPVFNLERLLYMTGYEAMSPRGSTISVEQPR
jgi:hypothetical protein